MEGAIKYWLRIKTDWTVSPLVKDACILATSSSLQWANSVKQNLDGAGFSYVWLNPDNVDPQQLCAELKERLTDQYIQHWQSELRDTTGKLRSYKLIKEDFKRESYLELPPYMRVPVARLRTSTHPLRIEIGRYVPQYQSQLKNATAGSAKMAQWKMSFTSFLTATSTLHWKRKVHL